jgi:hypothetical protein
LTNDEEYRRLLAQYAEQVAAFRKFCIEHGGDAAFEETDFTGFSMGFFIALGVVGDSGTGEAFYDASMLASYCRYRLQYWEGQTL